MDKFWNTFKNFLFKPKERPLMKMSDAGLELIKQSEGFVGTIYLDQAGLPTIGYGHLLTEHDKKTNRFVGGLTKEQATELLRKDVSFAEDAVNDLVKVPLSQGQFDALCDFAYNLGRNAIASSTLLKKINEGKYDEAPAQFMKWVNIRNKEGKLIPLSGLIKRRRKEVDLWNG